MSRSCVSSRFGAKDSALTANFHPHLSVVRRHRRGAATQKGLPWGDMAALFTESVPAVRSRPGNTSSQIDAATLGRAGGGGAANAAWNATRMVTVVRRNAAGTLLAMASGRVPEAALYSERRPTLRLRNIDV